MTFFEFNFIYRDFILIIILNLISNFTYQRGRLAKLTFVAFLAKILK